MIASPDIPGHIGRHLELSAAQATSAPPDIPGHIGRLLELRAAQTPDAPFVIEPDTGVTLALGTLQRARAGFGAAMASAGLAAGDRVLVVCPNSAAAALALLSVMGAGAVAVPASPESSGEELAHLLASSGAGLILAAQSLAPNLAAKTGATPLGPAGPGLSWLKVPDPPPMERPGFDLALILYTSGTTGRPKGVRLTHGNLLAAAGNVALAHALGPKDRGLCLLPLHHVNGLVVTLLAPLLAGFPVIMPPRFSVRRLWDWARAGATFISGVPTIWTMALSKPTPPKGALAALRFLRSASAPLPAATLAETEERLGVPVIESYGITEAASQVTSNPWPPEGRRPGSAGRPYGLEVSIDERGALGDLGGEVLVSGPSVSPGYWRDPDADAAAFEGGRLRTGDLGRLDGDGYLWLTGRLKELINRAGEMISPREVDDVLHRCPGVEQAGVVGAPHPLYGERVVAIVKPRPGFELAKEELGLWCRERLSPHKRPELYHIVEDLPKGPGGKISRRGLLELHLALSAGDGVGS